MQDKKLGELATYKSLLNTFINTEIVRWPQFQAQYAAEVAEHPDIFAGEGGGSSSPGGAAGDCIAAWLLATQ
jgi:hypothetical protein